MLRKLTSHLILLCASLPLTTGSLNSKDYLESLKDKMKAKCWAFAGYFVVYVLICLLSNLKLKSSYFFSIFYLWTTGPVHNTCLYHVQIANLWNFEIRLKFIACSSFSSSNIGMGSIACWVIFLRVELDSLCTDAGTRRGVRKSYWCHEDAVLERCCGDVAWGMFSMKRCAGLKQKKVQVTNKPSKTIMSLSR